MLETGIFKPTKSNDQWVFFLTLMATCIFYNKVKTVNSDPGDQAVMNEYKAFPTTRISVKKCFEQI